MTVNSNQLYQTTLSLSLRIFLQSALISFEALFALDIMNKIRGSQDAKRVDENQIGLIRDMIRRHSLGEFRMMWAASFFPIAMLLILFPVSNIVSSLIPDW